MRLKLYSLLILLFSVSTIFGQSVEPRSASGLFLTFGVGPRVPFGELGDQQAIGAGFDGMLSFTDSDFAPLFFYLNIGYQNHPGDYDYYKNTDLSSLTTNIVSFHGGARYFLSPLIKDMILLMPIIEGGVTYAFVEKYSQYKIDQNKKDNLEGLSEFGFHIGGGLSFFLMDIIATYNYLKNNQYLSLNLRLTLPLAFSM